MGKGLREEIEKAICKELSKKYLHFSQARIANLTRRSTAAVLDVLKKRGDEKLSYLLELERRADKCPGG